MKRPNVSREAAAPTVCFARDAARLAIDEACVQVGNSRLISVPRCLPPKNGDLRQLDAVRHTNHIPEEQCLLS